MKTWDDYKTHAKSCDPKAKKMIEEMEEIAKIVGVMIEQREQLGFSQRELARRCGMPQSSIARIESHKTIPNVDTLIKILNQLNLKLAIIPAKE